MDIKFDKMQGLGNDFVVIDAISQKIDFNPHRIKLLGDRHYGIGFDQLLVVNAPRSSAEDFYFSIYNSDGSEVEQCGNGARCVAKFIVDHQLSQTSTFRLGSLGGIISAQVDRDAVSVDMGLPRFKPDEIPFISDHEALGYMLHVGNQNVEIIPVNMGNPHAILPVEHLEDMDIHHLGQQIATHPQFPEGVNVGFMEVLSKDAIRLITYERGAGQTLACGTSACAAVVAGIASGFLDENVEVKVSMPGGVLFVSWSGDLSKPVNMRGPAVTVFSGVISIE